MTYRPIEPEDYFSSSDHLRIVELPDEENVHTDSGAKDGTHPGFGQAITVQLATLRSEGCKGTQELVTPKRWPPTTYLSRHNGDESSVETTSSRSESPIPTFYDFLEVDPAATRHVIKKAFKAKVRGRCPNVHDDSVLICFSWKQVAVLKEERDTALSNEDWDAAHQQIKNFESMYKVLREGEIILASRLAPES